MASFDYGLFDADNHYYEPPDCFTRFIEPAFWERSIRMVERDGKRRVLVGDKPFSFLSEGFRVERVARAGALRELLRSM